MVLNFIILVLKDRLFDVQYIHYTYYIIYYTYYIIYYILYILYYILYSISIIANIQLNTSYKITCNYANRNQLQLLANIQLDKSYKTAFDCVARIDLQLMANMRLDKSCRTVCKCVVKNELKLINFSLRCAQLMANIQLSPKHPWFGPDKKVAHHSTHEYL